MTTRPIVADGIGENLEMKIWNIVYEHQKVFENCMYMTLNPVSVMLAKSFNF